MKQFVKCLSVAAAVAMVWAAPSEATIISVGSNVHNFNWSYGSAAGALTGNGTLTVSGFNSNTLAVDVSLTNTSALASNRLTSFGFGIDPDASSVAFQDANDNGMVNALLGQIPSLATIEVCAFGGRNCNGGSNGGIYGNGGTDTFSLMLTRSGVWGSQINIDPIGFKYQTGNGSFEFTTGNDIPVRTTQNVPEPSMFALMGLGLLALGWGKRKLAS